MLENKKKPDSLITLYTTTDGKFKFYSTVFFLDNYERFKVRKAESVKHEDTDPRSSCR